MSAVHTIYQDDYLLAVSKPSGLHSVKLDKSEAPSLATLLLEKFPELKNSSPDPNEAGLVHRLDFSTSGIVVVAKSRDVWKALREQFSKSEVDKTYHALVEGQVLDQLFIHSYLGNQNRRGKKVKIYKKKPSHGRAQNAETVISPILYLPDKDTSLVELKMKSGVRHQIRAHSAHVGHPLLGDALYGSSRALTEDFPEMKRDFFLHASRLVCAHPATNTELEILDDSQELISADVSLRTSMS